MQTTQSKSSSQSNKSQNPKRKKRIIHLTEISVINFPDSADYKYKCCLQVISKEGQRLVEKQLFIRMQPKWLLDLKHKGECSIIITLSVRQGDITQPWQEVGSVTFTTEQVLKEERSIELEFPISTWKQAPQLKLQTRLTQDTREASSNTVTLTVGSSSGDRQYTTTGIGAQSIKVEIPAAVTLSTQEKIIVKDVWNKLRAFKELCMEMFFERLLLEAPELLDIFDDIVDWIREGFYELFDCCVRELEPQTENVIRESLTGVPPERGDEFDTIEDYGSLFADIGMRSVHWLKAGKVWMWMLSSIPYLEEYDREDLAKGTNSALYRFFNTYVIVKMVEAIERCDRNLPPQMFGQMWQCWQVFSEKKQKMGLEFYQSLFEKYPSILPLFGQADIDHLSAHLFHSLEFHINCLKNGETFFLPELRELGRLHGNYGVPSSAYAALSQAMLPLFDKYVPNFTPELRQAWHTWFRRVNKVMKLPKLNEEKLLKKARQWIDLIASEQTWEQGDWERRWIEIEEEIKSTVSYKHTYEELAYGAQVAWRNASKCIGRIQWNNMIVRDRRHVTDPDAMYEELLEHLRLSTNGGNLQVTMTVFRPKQPKERWGPRIWNSQLLRYAGYQQEDGTILGDPANLKLTEAIIELGWKPPEVRTPYDILPWVIEVPGHEPKIYEIPEEDILQVEIEHPTIPEFKSLGLRWYAVPAVSNFRMDLGGLTYPCIPFNGWYMGTEIARNFLDESRYNKIEEIGRVLKLDLSNQKTLWRDRVLLELNLAILHSFEKAKVTIVDHQTASYQFLSHDLREKKAGRECPADWGWVVPPAGGSTCPVFHHEMRDFFLAPSYQHAADKWAVQDGIDLEESIATSTQEEERKQDRILILYGSETGTAEGFARKVARQLQRYRPEVMALDDYSTQTLASEKLLLIVSSTFGNGEMPANGKKFLEWLKQQPSGSLRGLNYSVLGMGSTVYENFCAAAVTLDRYLAKAGANRIISLHKADQVKKPAETFNQWLRLVSRILGEDATSVDTDRAKNAVELRVTYLNNLQLKAIPRREGIGDRGLEIPVVANKELLKKVIPGSRSTRSIVFDISGTDLSYETGDHLAVYPCNPPQLVQRLCARLGVKPNTYFTLSYVGSDGAILDDKPPFNLPTTVGQVLSEELDLSLREPLDDLLAFMYSVAENPQDKKRLETWLSILQQGSECDDSLALKKIIIDNFLNVVDLLDEFLSVKVTLEALIELLPKQKPRLYSISSSPLLHPNRIQITVGVVQVVRDTGKVHPGLCSNYLAGLFPENRTKARIAVRASTFRAPRDLEAPILMVGPGTGISPLIGFLQERETLLKQHSSKGNQIQLGEAWLYFGCRNYNDYLYQEELESWLNRGILNRLEVAFSRLTDEKVYVQHLIKEQAQEIWELLSHPKCHYYACGDAKMSENVFEVLMAIAKQEGGLSHLEAVQFFDKMKKEKRFFTDVWGVTFNYKQAIESVRQDNYSRGERWLKQRKQESVIKPNS